MSKSNALENDALKLFFNSTALSWAVVTDLYISLHTADPQDTGNQTTSEASFGSYARVAVSRNDAGWTVTGNQATNVGAITFPQCTSGTATITHFGIGTASTGTGRLLYSGSFSSSLAVSNGITVTINAGQLTITED